MFHSIKTRQTSSIHPARSIVHVEQTNDTIRKVHTIAPRPQGPAPFDPTPTLRRWSHLSRTQILLTKITQICQEIRDIRRSKINIIITKLPELSQHHIHIPESSDNYDKGDPGDVYCRNSSSSHLKDRSHSPNKRPLYGQPYAPMLPSPTPSS